MPHQVHQRKFGRQTGHRKAMLRNLTLSVLRYEQVKTTEAKAKEVRKFVDGMIVLGKNGSLVARRKAIGWLPEEKEEFGAAQHSAWETVQRSHAIANGCYVAAANRVGHEAPAGGDGIEFWGQSFICGPDGEIVAKGSVDQEEIVIGEIDWDRVNEYRTHWPFLRDRRVDAYAGIEQRLLD